MARLGEIIDGKYEILREIGKGGMSVVYLAMDKRLNKQWAIKEFRKDKGDESKQVALKALLDEANLMKKLDHPTLPRIVDIIDTHQTVYVVMDYIEGESLNKVLDAYGAQPQEAVIEWAKQLSAVLDYLHTQSPPVIYRDMKPANIMLKPDGTVRLIDFGIAREYKEGKDGDTEAIGTRGYAAPEQFGGKGQTDARTDIYSLGVTLYHLVTGKNPAEPPYEIYPIRHWNSALSSGLEWLIQKCTQLNPNDRYQSCAEITYVLENLDKFEGAYKKKQKSRINQFIACAVATVVLGLGSAGFFAWARGEKAASVESYKALNTIEGYSEALKIEPEEPQHYFDLVQKLRNEITVISAEETEEDSSAVIGNTISQQRLTNLFPTNGIEDLRSSDDIESKKAYANINYELGRMYWNNYEGKSGQPIEAVIEANKYFKRVVDIAKTLEKEGVENAGLNEQKYNLAKAYYLVSYFQSRKHELSNQDDGQFELDETVVSIAEGYGLNEKSTKENLYYVFWVTNQELLSLLGGENDISDVVRLNSMKSLAYVIIENYADFQSETKDKDQKVDGQQMISMYTAFQEALAKVSDNDKNANIKEEIKKELNMIRPFIASLYKVEIEEVQ